MLARDVRRHRTSRLDETEAAPAEVVDGRTIPVRVPASGIATVRLRNKNSELLLKDSP